MKQWAADELRSANGQIEFILREALHRNHRSPVRPAGEENGSSLREGSLMREPAESSAAKHD